MNSEAKIIVGGEFNDTRGTIFFVNDFDMKEVKRFYAIEHPNTKIVRAWQGHKIEKKWFYCIKGSFEVALIKIDDWSDPSTDLKCEEFVLKGAESEVLFIPGGYVNGFRALNNNSKMIIFSDKSIGDSEADDFRFDKNLWKKW